MSTAFLSGKSGQKLGLQKSADSGRTDNDPRFSVNPRFYLAAPATACVAHEPGTSRRSER
ncbi:MAG: hypothetical protein U0350_15665 [Caldilineaceae bacterium]